ncbi:MAG: NAD(P)/FAD-dependent oxidoreductase [Vitreoscilla sp.]|nr:NAD(P)/FAD-dependent oxidoreductase [Burkholderiales bacterium]MBP6336205.1 NAD(P)/FAD-dependent oxidoreductase [Vitreoscilla sp.]
MTTPNWNLALQDLPTRCDVLVVGAGPSGSACAKLLAEAGKQVVLVDAQAFPRDKVCGDGLVPDTHAALQRLGLLDAVLERARAAKTAHCVAPSGGAIDVPGALAVLPRRELDAILCAAAVKASAVMAAPVRFDAPLRHASGRVTGALLSQSGQTRAVQAHWLVLASGAAPATLLAAGVCERRTPSSMALRAYVRHTGTSLNSLHFVWHASLHGGYGWVFPGPGHSFNIGVGVMASAREAAGSNGKRPQNLRSLFETFVEVDPLARQLWRDGEHLSELKGAPLRCDLDGSLWTTPGLLVVGDAAGATYSFTGEGIGKAMETGIAAAECLIAGGDDPAIAAAYTTRLHALKPRFDMYRKAASFNRHPWLLSLLVWRAKGSPRMIARFADILGERRMPGTLLSWRGVRALFRG